MSGAAKLRQAVPRQRVDVWLHRARFFKTRSLAEDAVEEGAVRLQRNGETRRLNKPGEHVSPGDALLIAAEHGLRAVRIVALGERRGPAPEARALYQEQTLDD